MTENLKTASIQIRVSKDEKTLIETKAAASGMKVSDYLRTAALNDETTITLEEGAAIARLLVEMQKNLNHMCAKGVVSDRYASLLLHKLEETWELFDQVSEKLTDMHQIADEDEEAAS